MTASNIIKKSMLHHKQNIFKEDVKHQNKQPLRKVYLMTATQSLKNMQYTRTYNL